MSVTLAEEPPTSDEYSPLTDSNGYTNLDGTTESGGLDRQHRWPLSGAFAQTRCGRRGNIGLARRRRRQYLPHDDALGVHPKPRDSPRARNGTSKPPPEQYPLLLHFPHLDIYRRQVTKQADLVLAMFLRGDAFN